MSIQTSLQVELEREAQNTERFLQVLSANHFSYKPHPKSMSLGELASHVVELHGWMAEILKSGHFDFHTDYVPLKATTKEDLLTALKNNVANCEAELAKFNEDDYFSTWTLKAGDHIIAELPKAGAIRFIVNNHLIHHRGQLSVYMRMLDLPLPGIYGPSADEKA